MYLNSDNYLEGISNCSNSHYPSRAIGSLPSTFDPVYFFCEWDNKCFPVTVESINPDGHYVINYDDVDVDTFNI